MKLRKLHHAVLRVRDLDRSVAFYRDVLGFREVARIPGAMAFLSLGTSHHDLALQALGMSAPPPEDRRVGLYHLAFEVETLGDLAEARERLTRARSLVGASDHGVSKSLYAKDPDGIEFELLWNVPASEYGDRPEAVVEKLEPLDLEGEIASRGAGARSAGGSG